MDNFFYNLNDKLNAIRATPETQLNESAVAEASYSAKAARAGKDIGKPGKNFEKIAKSAGERYGSKAAGERVAGAVLNKLRHPKEDVAEDFGTTAAVLGGAALGAKLGKTVGIYRDAKQKEKAGLAQPRTGMERLKGAWKGVAHPDYGDKDEVHKINPKYRFEDEVEEGGIPMTAKQKSFAALAPPKDKITFADKIAGAKQEVEEMLGDVAAEAIKSALTPKQKKLDRNNNGKLDAQDFEMLRKGAKQETDEGWDEMERDVKKRMGPRVGDVKRGARHDIETTATGVRATRRYDDETDDQPTGEKRRAGRPKGADKGPERVTAKAYKHKGGRVKEDGMEDMIEPHDSGEYDREGEMAKDSIKTVVRHAQALEKILGDNDNLPEWVQSKLAKIESMMTAVDDYMQNQQGDDQALDEKAVSQAQRRAAGIAHAAQKGEIPKSKLRGASKEMAKMPKGELHKFAVTKEKGLPKHVEEESTDKEDQRAERAGKKVAKDIEYDEGHKGKDDAKAEKAGKRVTKDIEYDDKKDRKEKKVAETTTSGSVATGGDAPKASKGGMQIGKGIYDSLNRKLENMISESMSINVSMTNDDNGSHKNITVTADDEDAEVLAQLLARAGLTVGGMQHDHGHEEPCPDCGSVDCGCDEAVEEAYGDVTATENKPDWPTDTEYSDDSLQYSGGLNKPKTDVAGDGQTTIPVTAVHTQDEDELRRMMEMAGIDQSKLKPWERTMKEEEAVEEGVVDTVKSVVKKGLEKLGHGSDEEMIKDLQKKTGVPATGKKPEDKKMEESLMQEFANFKI